MKTYKFTIDVYVYADSERDAAEALISEMDYLAELDNPIQAYTHPEKGAEVNPESIE